MIDGGLRAVAATALWLLASVASADDLLSLSRDFWTWRAATKPQDRDDVPRVVRPAAWAPDWAPAALAERRRVLSALETRWRALAEPRAPVPWQVDRVLLGSALARVRWELDGRRSWRRDPGFYVDQTVAAVVEALIPPPPFDAARAVDVVARLRSIPATLAVARANLDEPVASFARLAIADLDEIAPRLAKAVAALAPELPTGSAPSLAQDAERAARALDAYREWLKSRLPSMSDQLALGRDTYTSFLREVALLPYAPEELVAMGRQELARATAFEGYAAARARQAPVPELAATQAEQSTRAERAEAEIRRHLDARGFLSVPLELPHYCYRPLPAYLEALHGFGEETDFASLARTRDTATRWIPRPSPELGFWAQVMARDPRPHMAHEGVPGHAFQLALGYRHPDEIRRHWYDSAINEGLGTYAEELVLESGLLDDSPWARETVYRFLRLRALRVEVDVRLATGTFTVDEAAEYLRTRVPMDAQTAREEAASYAASPGFAIDYLIGKLQITQFLAEARRAQGEAFRLREFHDFLWQNGNVPVVLQRWEYLGERDQLDALERGASAR
jgi:hypothetical protein